MRRLYDYKARERSKERGGRGRRKQRNIQDKGIKSHGVVCRGKQKLFEEILSAGRRANELITFWPGKNAIFTIRVVSHPYLDPAPPVVKPRANKQGQ